MLDPVAMRSICSGRGTSHLEVPGERPASRCLGGQGSVPSYHIKAIPCLSPSSKLECACRRILHRPSDLQWRLLSYKEADEALAITDLQRLEHASLASVTPIDTGAELSKHSHGRHVESGAGACS